MTWYTTSEIAKDIYLISEPFGKIWSRWAEIVTVNMYLIVGQERAVLIDTGAGIGNLGAEVARITTLPCSVFNTHYHWDHIGSNIVFAETAIHEFEVDLLAKLGQRFEKEEGKYIRQGLQAASSKSILPSSFNFANYSINPPPATRILYDGDLIDLGDRLLRVLHIPGHSPGHVAYFDEINHILFSGDTAYLGPMYTCFKGGNPRAFMESIKRLAALNTEMVCPGHNGLITSPNWLGELVEFMKAIVAGTIHGQSSNGFIVGQGFRGAGFSIWLPLSRGSYDEK